MRLGYGDNMLWGLGYEIRAQGFGVRATNWVMGL